VIVPNFENLAEFLTRNALDGKPGDEVVSSPALRGLFHARLHEFNRTLSDIEAIAAFTLVARPFTQEAGELTPTMKLRRRVVQEHYQEQIDAMYRD